MTDDTEDRSLIDEINLTRIVTISFALSLLLTAGASVAVAQGQIDSNDSLFCKKIDDGANAGEWPTMKA